MGKAPPLQQAILRACIKIHRNLPFKISVDLELCPIGKGNLEELDLPLHDSPPGEDFKSVWVRGSLTHKHGNVTINVGMNDVNELCIAGI